MGEHMRPGFFAFPRHQVQGTLDWIGKLQPSVVKGFLSVTSGQWWGEVSRLSPGSLRILVHGEASDNPDMSTPEADAESTARAVDSDSRLPRLIILKNEPHIWDGPAVRRQVADYTCRWLTRAHQLGLNGVVGEFSNGWQHVAAIDGDDWWADFGAVEATMGPGDYWGLHEYWGSKGPLAWWPWTCGRHMLSPTTHSIIIDECGFDLNVDGAGDNGGWVGRLDADAYVGQIVQYHQLLYDPRVKGTAIFLFDYDNNHWASFDLWPIMDRLSRCWQECSYRDPRTVAPASMSMSVTAGQPVLAPAAGIVDKVESGYIRINCWWGFVYLTNMASVSVQAGSTVSAGQVLGMTGAATHMTVSVFGPPPALSAQPAPAPAAQPTSGGTAVDLIETMRNTVINAINKDSPIPYNPQAAFPQFARQHNLGAPLTVELNVQDCRCQGYAMGWVWAKIGDWGNIHLETY